jgi:site-specific DNA-adenine methylase
MLYLDPPWDYPQRKHYDKSFTEQDHWRLALALMTTRHDWILSYNDTPLVRRLYSIGPHNEGIARHGRVAVHWRRVRALNRLRGNQQFQNELFMRSVPTEVVAH